MYYKKGRSFQAISPGWFVFCKEAGETKDHVIFTSWILVKTTEGVEWILVCMGDPRKMCWFIRKHLWVWFEQEMEEFM